MLRNQNNTLLTLLTLHIRPRFVFFVLRVTQHTHSEDEGSGRSASCGLFSRIPGGE